MHDFKVWVLKSNSLSILAVWTWESLISQPWLTVRSGKMRIFSQSGVQITENVKQLAHHCTCKWQLLGITQISQSWKTNKDVEKCLGKEARFLKAYNILDVISSFQQWKQQTEFTKNDSLTVFELFLLHAPLNWTLKFHALPGLYNHSLKMISVR